MSKPLKVGLQLSIGGLGDLSFNDSAYRGLEIAKEMHGIEFVAEDWQNPMLNANNMESWANEDIDLIIGIGYGNAAPVSQVAAQHPHKKFAVVDVAAEGSNVWSATYREYEGDYVVGALAGLITQTRMVGFMGGGVTPIVRRIELGFAQGVKNSAPSIAVVSDYVGEFDDPEKGRVLAETQYTLGVDVLYQVAGRCGLGAIEAAKKFSKWIISTGGDHYDLAPSVVLTSRIKNVGKPIIDIIEATIKGQFEGGVTKSYGFAEGGLMLAPIRPNMFNVIPQSTQSIMQEIQAQVVSGQIEVELEDD